MPPETPSEVSAPQLASVVGQSPGAERELVGAVLRKDRKATARFVAEYTDGVYAYVRHRLAPRADLVDDLVQDVFLAQRQGDGRGNRQDRQGYRAAARACQSAV
jgi:DNA-directed RNA polymerase specialized sigma24 family protein